MGFTKGGIELEARNFKTYLRQLESIEKKQDQAFSERSFRGAERGFRRIEDEAKKYERQLQRTAKAQNAFLTGLGGFAAGFLSRATLQAIADSAQAAAAFQGQQRALGNLAASYGQAGTEIQRAISRAADGVLSQSEIIDVALQGVQLQAAKTPEEFERLTAALARIGQARGIGSAEAIRRGFLGISKNEVELLDELGLSARVINNELEKLSQRDFGKPASGLSAVERQALFAQAALIAAEDAAARFGEDAGSSQKAFERITAETENLRLVMGTALLPVTEQFAGKLADALVTAQQIVSFISAGAAGVGSLLQDIVPQSEKSVGELFEGLLAGEVSFEEFLLGDLAKSTKTVEEALNDATQAATEAFKQSARAQGVVFPGDEVEASTEAFRENSQAIQENEAQVKALQQAIRQAEQIELSFSRAAEDSARNFARSQEKLARNQEKARQKLLDRQVKELEEFEADRLESIAETQEDILKEEARANREREREMDRFRRQARQAEERFNLDRIQSSRRFALEETRLRASGDVLGLMRLREDFQLSEQEQAESFDLQQRQAKENQQEQTKTQIEEQEDRLAELKEDLEDQRAELLRNFDEQLANLEESQREQRDSLLESYAEQQQDRMINYQRQIEDLGRSLAQQEDLTKEGAAAIAQQLEEAFGQDGIADQIMSGFTMRQESAFQKLFESIGEGAKEATDRLKELSGTVGSGTFGATGFDRPRAFPERLAEFQEGGVVGGPTGAPQLAIVHGGETVLPTHRMAVRAPELVEHRLTGRANVNVQGLENASQATVDRAVDAMIETMDVAMKRAVRRHGAR